MSSEINQLKTKAISSIMSLFFQSSYSAFLGLIANLILTILLTPKIFGIYITVLSIISLFNYFSDIGLAASLIQKKEVTNNDVKTTFTVQQLLILFILTLGFIATPMIQNFYKFPQEGIILYWALLVAFFISSLKTIPSIFLERKIQFKKIVLVQIIENTLFYVSVSVFALLGLGLQSFTYGVIIRATSGLIAMYSLSFWVPRVGISLVSLKSLLSFGLPFQASSFLALFKDDLITLYLGKVLGFEGLGYIGWAKKWAEAPIRIIMDNISRVLFPVISRVQQDKQKVTAIIERFLYYQTMILAPVMLGMIIVMEKILFIIPRYSKWYPALPLFYLFCISAFFSSFSTPFINVFNALGKAKISFSFMVIWTVLTWVSTPILTKLFGLYGFPLLQVTLSLSFIFIIKEARRYISFDFVRPVYASLSATVIMGSIAFVLNIFLGFSLQSVLLIMLVGAMSYYMSLKFLFKIDVLKEIKIIFKHE